MMRPSLGTTGQGLNSSILDLHEPNQIVDVQPSEIMKYYTPRWLAGVGLLSSFFAAFQLPLFGFMLAKIVFSLMKPIDDNWV